MIVSIKTERVPHIAESDRVRPDAIGEGGDGITRLTAPFGFKDDTDVPGALRGANRLGLLEGTCDIDTASYFLSQIRIVRSDTPGMSRWRKNLFLTLAHNAADPVEYFRLPEHRTLTIGERIEL